MTFDFLQEKRCLADFIVSMTDYRSWSEDACAPPNFTMFEHSLVVECQDAGEIIGYVYFNSRTLSCVEIHPVIQKNLLKTGVGSKMVAGALKYFDKNIPPKKTKIMAYIPVYEKKLIKSAKKLGFKKEGFEKRIWLKEGKLHNRMILGIERTKIKELEV